MYYRDRALFGSHVAAQDIAELFPLFALEALHLELFDRGEVVRTGVDGDARQDGVRRAKPFRLAACFITFSRVRLSPDCFSTCTRVWAAE